MNFKKGLLIVKNLPASFAAINKLIARCLEVC